MTALLWHGRLLCDMKPRATAFGMVMDWTIEDLDSPDTAVVASGSATGPAACSHEISTAALAFVRAENGRAA